MVWIVLQGKVVVMELHSPLPCSPTFDVEGNKRVIGDCITYLYVLAPPKVCTFELRECILRVVIIPATRFLDIFFDPLSRTFLRFLSRTMGIPDRLSLAGLTRRFERGVMMS